MPNWSKKVNLVKTRNETEAGIRGGLVLFLLGGMALLAILVSGMVLIPRYRAANVTNELQRSDAHQVEIEDLYLDVTLVTPSFQESHQLDRYLGGRNPQAVLPFLVGLNTHTGHLDHLDHLSGNFNFIGPDGVRYPSLTEPIVLSDHHNVYVVFFPSRDNQGQPFLEGTRGTLALEASDLGQKLRRRFEWSLPLEQSSLNAAGTEGLVKTFMLVVALIGALLVILSPCAVELTLYYSAILSCAAAEVGRDGAAIRHPASRRRMLINLGSFTLGFTLLYSASGATVGLIGAGVSRPLGDHNGLLQILGGSLILFFSMRVLGLDRWLRAGVGWAVGILGRFLGRGKPPGKSPESQWVIAGLSPGQAPKQGSAFKLFQPLTRWLKRNASERQGPMKARDSFLAGVGLSSTCLTCMGGGVLYPLLVYAGITSWYWGMITLGLYSLGIALPMIFIALGFYQIRFSLGRRIGVNRTLRIVSGTMLAGIALVILTGRESLLTDTAFRLIGGISRWFA